MGQIWFSSFCAKARPNVKLAVKSPRGSFLFHARNASPLSEIARVLVGLDHVVRFIVNANHSVV
jgi:hypothetical protein